MIFNILTESWRSIGFSIIFDLFSEIFPNIKFFFFSFISFFLFSGREILSYILTLIYTFKIKNNASYFFKNKKYIRVVIRERSGRTRGVGPSTGSGQRGSVPPRVRVGISRGRPVGPVHRGDNVFQNLLKIF